MLKKALLAMVMLLLLISFVKAKSFSVDPCAGDTEITQDASNFYFSSGCFDVTFPKDYNSNIDFYDKYNDDAFDLKLMQVRDVNDANTNQKKTTSFPSMGMTASLDGKTLKYTSSDGKFILTYLIQGSKVKAGFEITDWQSDYPIGQLKVQTRIHKGEQASASFISLPPIVDGVEGEVITEIETQGQNEFVVQTLFIGNSFTTLVVDPLYQVDYSPVPATHLITGYVANDSESDFASEIDVTAGVSDNNTATTYLISEKFETTIATEGWESGNQNGGTGWEDASWQSWDTACLVESADSPHSGTYHMEADAEDEEPDCDVYRTLNSSDCLLGNISFWAKANSLESGDVCRWYYYNGTTYTQLLSITDGGDDNTYRFYSYEVCNAYGTSATARFRIWADVSSYADDCWTDDIRFFTIQEEGNALSGRWNQTYDPTFDWFAMTYKTTSGTDELHIQAYDNSNDVASLEVTHTLVGTGWFATNISNLMDYMTNNQSLSYIQFRFWTEDEANISELMLRQEVNDTTEPTIHDCSINDTQITCFESVHLDCNITDDVVVDDVYFQVNSINYTAVQHIDHYAYDFTPDGEGDTLYDWEQVYAIDIVGNQNQTDPSLSFTYNCSVEDYINITNIQVSVNNISANITWDTNLNADSLVEYGLTISLGSSEYNATTVTSHFIPLTNLTPNTTYYYNITSTIGNLSQTLGVFNFTTNITGCLEDWVQDPIVCLTNDTYLITYTDNEACGTVDNLPVDNGTYGACNYCSEDIVNVTGSCVEVSGNFVQNLSYQDNNYFSCCVVTGIISDCSIDFSPFNETTTVNCSPLQTDFDLELDLELFFGFGFGGLASDKVFGKLFINDTNNTYNCITYVKTTTGELLQTNPPYTQRVPSTVSIIPREIEDREFFTTRNGLANVYWTDDQIVVDGRSYIFGAECATDNNVLLTSEVFASTFYEPINAPITRWFWLRENLVPLILGLLMAIAILFLIAYGIRELRRR